jgi:hypothetical protein
MHADPYLQGHGISTREVVVVVAITKDQPRGLLPVTESNRNAGKPRGKSNTTVVNERS